MKYRVKIGNFAFGVPVRFLLKYNPEQLSLVSVANREYNLLRIKTYTAKDAPNWNDLNGGCVYIDDDSSYHHCFSRYFCRLK